MTDYKEQILEGLNLLRKKEQQEGNTFKAIAYSKVVSQLKSLPSISSMEDLQEVKGIGESIRKKIEEILETGKLEAAEEIRADTKVMSMDDFMNIYGVGRVKAKKLVKDMGIKTIEELRKKVEEDADLLNTNQKIGLKYYEDFLERIPREEMKKHEKLLQKEMKGKGLQIEIVGSYRRGEPSSGDIDVLVKWDGSRSEAEKKKTLQSIVENLEGKGYITDVLALGDKKFMGVCKIEPSGKGRRLDILLTPEEEYGFAVMYFTGSDKFNVEVRKIALEKGYSMNEHGFTPKSGVKPAPFLDSEEAIFQFLGYEMIPPKNRKDGRQLTKFLVKNS